ncbi:MAG: AEC family transporter [Syntrophobacteraceae bacterium]
MELLTIFAGNILPIFLLAGVGFLLARYLKTDVQTLSRVTLYAFAPCLVFDMLVTSGVGSDEFARIALFATCTVIGIGAIAWLVTRALRLDRVMAGAFMVVVMFANGGNYGLPLTLFAFGQEALACATIYFVSSVVLTYTIGIFVASSGRGGLGQAIPGMLKVPCIYAATTAILLMILDITPPPLVMRPVKLLSNAAIPTMLLVLGMQLKGAVKPEMPGVVALAVGLRLIVSMFLGFALAQLVGLDGVARQAAIIQTAMPVAVVTTILAAEFEVEPKFVTTVVFISTILSPFTLTPLIAWLR